MSIPFTLDIAVQPQQKDIKWVAAGDWAKFDDTVFGLEQGDVLEQAAFTVKLQDTDADDAVTSVQRMVSPVESANGQITGNNRIVIYFQPTDTEKMVSSHLYDLQIWVRRGTNLYVRTIQRGRIYARQDITNSVTLLDPMTTLTITNGASASGAPGTTLQLIAEVRDGQGDLHPEYNPVWTTSNGAVATVDATGLVRFWGAGTCVITATLAQFSLADSINITTTGANMLAAVTGDVLTYDGSVWNPADPQTRAYTWTNTHIFQQAITVTASGSVFRGGSDASSLVTIGQTGGAPTATRDAALLLIAPHSVTNKGRAYIAYQQNTTTQWYEGLPTTTISGAMSALTDFVWQTGGGSNVAALTQAGMLRTVGGLYTSGNAAVGPSSPSATVGLYVTSDALTSADQRGGYFTPSFNSAATASGYAVYAGIVTASGAWSMTQAHAVSIGTPSLGNTAVTSLYGLYVANQGNAKVTSSYGVYVGAQSGSTSNNFAIYTAGGRIQFGGTPQVNAVMMVSENMTASGGAAFGSYFYSSLTAAANSNSMVSMRVDPRFTPGAYTSLTVTGFMINGFSTAAFTSGSEAYGINIGSLTGTNMVTAYGLNIGNVSGATNNYAIYTGSGLIRFGGSIGLQTTPATQIGITIAPVLTGSTTQQGLSSNATYDSGATVAGYALAGRVNTTAAAYTMATAYVLYAQTPVVGAGSAITTSAGVYVMNMGATGVTNAYGVYISAQSGAATTNIGLYNAGTSRFEGAIGVAIAPTTIAGIYVRYTTIGGVSQYGAIVQPIYSNDAQYGYGVFSNVQTVASAFTLTGGYALYASTPTLGAGSAITSQHGLYVANQGATGITNAYGIYIAAQSGASSQNIGFYNGGISQFYGRATAYNTLNIGAVASGWMMGIRDGGTGLAGTQQGAIYIDQTYTSAATSNVYAIYNQLKTAAAVFNTTSIYGLYFDAPVFGTGHTVGTHAAIYIGNQGAANVTGSSYGLYIAAQAGSTNFSVGIHNAGTTRLTKPVYIGDYGNGQIALAISGTGITTAFGNSAYGIYSSPTLDSGATSGGWSMFGQLVTASGAWTMTSGYGLQIGAPSLGNTAVTNIYGVRIENQGQAKSTNAYGLYIVAQSGAASDNIALFNAGTSRLNGGVSIGTLAPSSVYGLILYGSNLLTGTSQYNINAQMTFTSAATSIGSVVSAAIITAAAAFTMGSASAFRAETPVYGAGSAVTNSYGLLVSNHGAAAVTNAYGIYIAAQSGAATTNIGLYNAGTSTFAGSVTMQDMLTINGSGSRLGIGTAAVAYYGIIVQGITLSGSTAQAGVYSDVTFGSGATTAAYAFSARVNLTAAAFTSTIAAGLIVQVPTLGAGSAATTMAGLYVKNQGLTGVSNAYGLYIEAQSGASSSNVGIYNGASSRFDKTIAINAAPPTNVALYMTGAGVMATASQYNIYANASFSSAATTLGTVISAQVVTAAGAWTMTTSSGLTVGTPSVSNTGITTNYGVFISNQATAAITNAYGIWIEAPNGGITTNIGLQNQGTTVLANAVVIGSATFDARTLLTLAGSKAASAGAAYGILSNITTTPTANNDEITQMRVAASIGATAYTGVTVKGIQVSGFSTAGMTTPASPRGIEIGVITGTGAAQAYGIYINAPTGATTNLGIYNLGMSRLEGQVGVGTDPSTAIALNVQHGGLAGTSQYGVSSGSTFTSAATSFGALFYTRMRTQAAVFTMASGYGIVVDPPIIGAGSAVTTMYGVNIANQGISGVTNAYGVYIQAQSGASSVNIGLYNAGNTQLNGPVGVGIVPATNLGFRINGSVMTTGASQYALYLDPTPTAAATEYGVVSIYARTSNATTLTAGYSIFLGSPIIGSTNAITTMYGVLVSNQGNAAMTNAYGIYIAAQSGAVTTNIGLYNLGTTRLDGTVGFGIAPTGAVALYVRNNNLTGTGQTAVASDAEFTSASTSSATAIYARVRTASAAYSTSTAYGINVDPPSLANTAVTTMYGVYIGNQGNAKVTHAYGVYIQNPTGAATTNLALYNGGDSQLQGVVGVGGGADASVAVYIRSASLTTTAQVALGAYPVFNSAAAGGAGYAVFGRVQTQAAAFTLTQGYAIYAAAPVVGATSAITTQRGVYVANQGASGITNAYGVYIEAQSGAATTNISLYNVGTTRLDSALAFGAAPLASRGLHIASSFTVTAASGVGYGAHITPTIAAAANGDFLYSLRVDSPSTPGAFTGVGRRGIVVSAFSVASFTTPADPVGIYVDTITATGATTAYGLVVASPTGAGTNYLISHSTPATFNVKGDGSITSAAALTINATGSIFSAGTDATTTLTIGSGGGSPTAVRQARINLNAPDSGTYRGVAITVMSRNGGTALWEYGIDNTGASGAKTSDTDFYWYSAVGAGFVASLTTAGALKLASSVTAGGAILSTHATAGVGYGTGAGGAVTQITSRTTGVTLNKVTGAITLVSAAGSATYQSFTVTNSTVAATDVIRVVQKSGADLYEIHVTNVAAGSFQITYRTTGGTTTEQPVFSFVVLKGVAA